MPTTSESILQMLKAHVDGDDAGFRDAARVLITEERRKQHGVFAQEIERVLAAEAPGAPAALAVFAPGRSLDLPRDKERGLPLVELSEPGRGLDELVLSESLRNGLERIVRENKLGELLRGHGLRPTGRVLFCGPPGCGKTVAAHAVARALYLPVAIVRFDAVVSSFLGETAANLRRVFDFARTRPMVVLFDEFDAIGKRRADEDEHGELKRVVNSFLQMLDAFRGESLLIAATNHQGLLDPALWRRFDDIVFFDRPDVEQVRAMLLRCLRQIGASADLRIDAAARRLAGMSHADIERIGQDAVKHAIMEDTGTVDRKQLDAAIARQQGRHEVTERVTTRAVKLPTGTARGRKVRGER